MNFENEFFRLLESSKAKKIIQDMLGEKMYSEKEAIQRGDMHINEKNIIRKKIKNIAPQNERKVRKLEEELKQYEIQYKKGKALLEQLEKDLKEKDNKVNQLEKDIETKESKINHLEQELTDKCSEYDKLQKNYIEEKRELDSTKQQLICYVVMWLLSQGRNIEVIQPDSLRQEIKQTLLDMLYHY